MMAFGVVPRDQIPQATTRRLSLSHQTLLLLSAFALLFLLWLSPTMAQGPSPPNQSPTIIMYSTNLGGGYWKITGLVTDDQSPVGLRVDLWGPPIDADFVYVDSTKQFVYYAFIHVPGTVSAQTTDALGAASNVATCPVGY